MFKDIFKQLIQNSGLSSYQISKDTGISESLISHWKSGRQLPKYDSLNVLADYFKVSGDYLLGRTEDSNISQNLKNDKKIDITNNKSKSNIIMKPFYLLPTSAGTGSYLFDDILAEWVNVERTPISEKADFILQVRGDSMLPKLADNDKVYVQQSPSIIEGDIGVFIVDGESYIKKMGKGELISLNPQYKNIPLNEYTDCRCVGKVIGVV